MTTRIKTYPIVENAINLFGDWLKHRQEMREIRDMNSGDFARIATWMAKPSSKITASSDAIVPTGSKLTRSEGL